MTKEDPLEVTYAFIDAQNLYKAIREQGWELDYGRFRRWLTEKFNVSKAFLFIGYIAENESLYTYLQKQGFIIVFKPIMKLSDGRVKGNVDAELVLHTMIESSSYAKAVIVAGDGDYHCLVEHLAKSGKLRSLLVPNKNSYSALLRKFANDMTFLTGMDRRLGKKEGGSATGRTPGVPPHPDIT